MATLETIIDDVLYDLDRYDLLANARKNMRQILFECHAVAQFHRDLLLGAPVAASENLTIPLPANFRKLYSLIPYDSSGLRIPFEYAAKQARPYVDAYGFIETVHTYSLLGGSVNVQHAEGSTLPATIALLYYAYPSFTVAGDTYAVSSDSWMPVNHEAYIKAKLLKRLAQLTGDDGKYRVAVADEQDALLTLIAAEAEGI